MAVAEPMSVPVILQTEASECGLACLAMIARHHGHDIDLPSLRSRHLVSLTGASLKSVMQIAATLDLTPRPLKVDLDKLGNLQLPAILHWDFNHYVVLTKVTARHAHIIDPGIGARRVSLSEFSDHFTGIALELTPRTDFTPQTARQKSRLSMMWSKLIGLKRALLQTLTLSVILQLIVILMPFYLQIVVDGILPGSDLSLLIAVATGFAGLAVLRAVSEALRSYAILVFGNQMSGQMLGNIFGHLIRLPTSYFEKRHIGDIISRMGSTHPIQQALTQTVIAVLMDGVMAVVMLIVMIIYAPILAAIVAGSVAVLSLVTLLIYPKLRASQEGAIYAKAIENSHVIESIRGATTIKLFGREGEREAGWANLYTDVINANIDHGRWMIWQQFAQTLLVGLQMVAVVFVGAQMIMADGGADGFTLGMLFAFMAFRTDFTRAVTELLQKGIEFRLLGLHLDRLSDIVFAKPDNRQGDVILDDVKGEIIIDNVSFRYSDMDPWILRDVSLSVAAGDMVTLTGLSGGGKTTLLKLILGLYRPTSGRITIDGQDLSTLDTARWRSSLGVVMQDDALLTGSIAQNISVFDPEIDMARVVAAATTARIHDDIAALPMNYDSLVGAMGSVLSGGQKQRVLLARALYHQPRILCLDEGTANLDQATEAQIVEVIKAMDMTRIIVAHRPAFIEASDAVVTVTKPAPSPVS